MNKFLYFPGLIFVVGFCSIIPCIANGDGSIKRSECLNPHKKIGKCIDLLECPELFGILKVYPINTIDLRFLQGSSCGFTSNGNPKVCCVESVTVATTPATIVQVPITTTTMIPSRHELPTVEVSPVTSTDDILEKVKSHKNLRLLPTPKMCGNPLSLETSDRITGGSDAGLGSYPWMALLGFTDKSGGVQYACGGTLINSKYVLTAAHCVVKLPEGFHLTTVRIGEYDKDTNPDCDGEICAPSFQEVEVDEILPHENYDETSKKENDLALIRIKKEAVLGPFVTPVCLPRGDFITGVPNNTKYYVSGWGRLSFDNRDNSKILQHVVVPLVSLNTCQKFYVNRGLKTIDSGRFCAGGEAGKDSCQGDSGGPIMTYLSVKGVRIQKRIFQLGVVSIGPTKCGSEGQPALYTKITNYLPWILDHIRP